MAESNVTRIVVSCDASPLGAAALDTAAALARRLDAELSGLFVEDINLLRMAALPFAREYALASAAARSIDVADVELALRRQADAVREAVSRAARSLQVPWSFQVVRGAMLDSVLAAMRDPGLAVLGHAGQFMLPTESREPRGAPRPERWGARAPILALFDGTPVAQRTLQVALTLARDNHTTLVLLGIAKDTEAIAKLRDQAAALLQGSGIQHHVHRLSTRDIAGIKKAAQTHHAAALLWAGLHGEGERKALAKLVDELACPVLLVT